MVETDPPLKGLFALTQDQGREQEKHSVNLLSHKASLSSAG